MSPLDLLDFKDLPHLPWPGDIISLEFEFGMKIPIMIIFTRNLRNYDRCLKAAQIQHSKHFFGKYFSYRHFSCLNLPSFPKFISFKSSQCHSSIVAFSKSNRSSNFPPFQNQNRFQETQLLDLTYFLDISEKRTPANIY